MKTFFLKTPLFSGVLWHCVWYFTHKKSTFCKTIKENLILALSVKVSILLRSVFGLANMWLAVFGDTGVTLLTILNTLRIMKKYR